MMKSMKTLGALRSDIFRFKRLCKLSAQLRRSFEADCNYGDNARRKTKQLGLIGQAKVLAHNMGYVLYVQGDCRGCALYLLAKGQNTNTYPDGIACC
jgi:hypothetical protein